MKSIRSSNHFVDLNFILIFLIFSLLQFLIVISYDNYFGLAGDDYNTFVYATSDELDRNFKLYDNFLDYLLPNFFSFELNVFLAYFIHCFIVSLLIYRLNKFLKDPLIFILFFSFPIFDTFTHLYRDSLICLLIVYVFTNNKFSNKIFSIYTFLIFWLRPVNVLVLFKERKKILFMVVTLSLVLSFFFGDYIIILISGFQDISLITLFDSFNNIFDLIEFRGLEVFKESQRPDFILNLLEGSDNFFYFYFLNFVSSILYPLSFVSINFNSSFFYSIFFNLSIFSNIILSLYVVFNFKNWLFKNRSEFLFYLLVFFVTTITFQFRHLSIFYITFLLSNNKIHFSEFIISRSFKLFFIIMFGSIVYYNIR